MKTRINCPKGTRYRCDKCGETFTDKHATGIRTLAPAECPKCGEESEISIAKAP